jgi:Nif-specific regulatory protein
VRRTATLAGGPDIVADDFACRHDECLSSLLWKGNEEERGFVPLPLGRAPRRPSAPPPPVSGDDDDKEGWDMPALGEDGSGMNDRARLIEVMESVGWVQAKAARVLGLTPRQIGYALRKYDIAIKKF